MQKIQPAGGEGIKWKMQNTHETVRQGSQAVLTRLASMRREEERVQCFGNLALTQTSGNARWVHY